MSARPDDATMINTLWFDKDGCGPDHFQLRLHPFKAEMARSEVAELHRQLGQWLAENP